MIGDTKKPLPKQEAVLMSEERNGPTQEEHACKKLAHERCFAEGT